MFWAILLVASGVALLTAVSWKLTLAVLLVGAGILMGLLCLRGS